MELALAATQAVAHASAVTLVVELALSPTLAVGHASAAVGLAQALSSHYYFSMKRALPLLIAALMPAFLSSSDAGEVVTKTWYNHKGEEVKQWVVEVKNPRRVFTDRRTYHRSIRRGHFHGIGAFYPIGFSRCYVPRVHYPCYRPGGFGGSYHGSRVGFHGSFGSYGVGCRPVGISRPSIGYRR